MHTFRTDLGFTDGSEWHIQAIKVAKIRAKMKKSKKWPSDSATSVHNSQQQIVTKTSSDGAVLSQ